MFLKPFSTSKMCDAELKAGGHKRQAIWLGLIALAWVFFVVPAAPAQTTTIKNIARLSTDGGYSLQCIGLVMGLPGTGDSGKELAMARPLAAVLKNNGNPVPDLKELAKTKSVALVMVTCKVPAGGARVNDQLPVTVSTLGSASSLDGGELLIAPLRGPTPGAPIYAMASGSISIENASVATVGHIQHGAQIIKPLAMQAPTSQFDLVLDPIYRGYGAASQVATAINDNYFNSPAAAGRHIARAIDDRTIAIVIPEGERAQPAAFIADVMATPIATTLLKLPARVICNSRSGAIVITGDVRIGPVALTLDGVSITTTVPTPVPTPADPMVTQSRWVGLTTEQTPAPGVKLEELLKAFDQLNIPAKDQIKLIQQIHDAGRLYAKLIVQ